MKRLCPWLLLVSLLVPLALAQSTTPKPLTIETAFAEGSITGRAPESIQWSPDNATLSFIQRDDAGEHGELWTLNADTGEKKVLLNDARLASLAPP